MQNETVNSLYPNLIEGAISGLEKFEKKRRWLVTGAAGFIGSNLIEALLSLGQEVTGLDDLSVGHYDNIELALKLAGSDSKSQFTFINGSITDIKTCRKSMKGVDFVLHHAALTSVPGSFEDPAGYHEINTSGFINILEAARENNVRRVVYASSSAVYGDEGEVPKLEDESIKGKFLSPYALTKYINEECAEFWTRVYDLECVGLRYFNVFGPRQDPGGAYAAVISKWSDAVKSGAIPIIYGDGSATRDFCAVQNVVLANLLAALNIEATGKVFNIGCGIETSLNELLKIIYRVFAPELEVKALHERPRQGDIKRSVASIELAKRVLNYRPIVTLEDGLKILKDSLITE